MNKYLTTAVNIISLISAVVGMLYWADSNLAKKADITDAKLSSEFRTIELQLSFNDYRISEIEKGVDPSQEMDLETKRVYEQIIRNSERLSQRRDELIISGVPKQ